MKVYVAGHSGLVGSALTKAIDTRNDLSWIGATHEQLDLTNRESVFRFVQDNKPDALIIAAAKVGGIVANHMHPVAFLSENIQISTNLLDAAHAADVEKLIFLGSSCAYPKFADQPIAESSILSGVLEETNEAYAIAKIAGIKLVEAYRQEFGRSWFSVMPTNLYGPGDNFDPVSSHVIPGLIGKFHKAKTSGIESVSSWGSGKPLREFLYSDDAAGGLLFLLGKEETPSIVNLGSGIEVSIYELASIVASVVGYKGKIIWDSSFPDGTPRKRLSCGFLNDLGWEATTSLEEGIWLTYLSYLESNVT
jgi:GDP-L-fucose synthase